MMKFSMALAALLVVPACAVAADYPDLPPAAQVSAVLDRNINVATAKTGVEIEEVNQRKLNVGNYEFNLRAGTARRKVMNTGQNLREWDVALERPVRLFGKAQLDADIGATGVARAKATLDDARHEAGRTLLRLWFAWQREQAQASLWLQQTNILAQQAQMTEKRMLAGDAPRMEVNQSQAAAAQAGVSLQQARLRARLAAGELAQQFPGLALPERIAASEPQAMDSAAAEWKDSIVGHSHELAMVQSEHRVQQLLAERSRADRVPDPTIGVRYSSEFGGNERVAGMYISVPFAPTLRSATAEGAGHQATIAASREQAVRRRLENDAEAAYARAVGNYEAWRQANDAAASFQRNADLVARAYDLGENSLADALSARRLALESALAAAMARLDANEARYRLLLDAHRLWQFDEP